MRGLGWFKLTRAGSRCSLGAQCALCVLGSGDLCQTPLIALCEIEAGHCAAGTRRRMQRSSEVRTAERPPRGPRGGDESSTCGVDL